MSQEQNVRDNQNKNVTNMPYDYYQKRGGTSGLGGQIYETKLLSLILLRALYDENIKEFVLGTNIDGLGIFDDIVLRYKMHNSNIEKIIFSQAKHRDDPNKYKLTVQDIFKQNSDFSLQKYLDSYLKIKNKFMTDKNNIMFVGALKDIECEFIIYTPARGDFDKTKVLEHTYETIMRTRQSGKIYELAYDNPDIKGLISTIVESRITQLAKSLLKFVFKDNFENMMLDDFIKTYHVYLAQNVVTMEPISSTFNELDNPMSKNTSAPYRTGRFQESFWTTSDENLVFMRHVICAEIAEMRGIKSQNLQVEVESILKTHVFKLHVDFGNDCFQFHGSEKKQQKRRDYLCLIFLKLLSDYTIINEISKYILVKVDDDLLAVDNTLKRSDFENYRLAGLVGNLLINDDETEKLKFNFNEESQSTDNILILERLKNNFDLSTYRFDFNINSFPKLTLNDSERDGQLVKDFLSKLRFYTDQAKEDEVENIVINEIDKLFSIQQKQNDSLFRVKRDAIFLKVHDGVQKWWKLAKSAPYLSKTCTFYEQAQREILHSPLLDINHFAYSAQIKSFYIEFDNKAVNSLNLDLFLNSDERIMIVVSDEIIFTSMKVIQYFDVPQKENAYIFLDLDFVLDKNCLEIVTSELKSCEASLLVVLSREDVDINNLNKIINNVMSNFKGKIIIIFHKSYDNLHIACPKIIFHKDVEHNFCSLLSNIRKVILEDRKLKFQGVEVNIGAVLEDNSLDLLSSKLLCKVIRNETVTIGKPLINASYDKTVDYYVTPSVCQYITLNYKSFLEIKEPNKKIILLVDDIIQGEVPQCISDVILKTETKDVFEEACKVYNESNVHWFTSAHGDAKMVWQQSHGKLENIQSFINRETHNDFTLQLLSLKDIKEKVVIISAEPGMGKSTMLTHLAVKTKKDNPNLWILKINLIDFTVQFDEWKKQQTEIDLKTAIIFLYTFSCENIEFCNMISQLVTVNKTKEIDLSDHDNTNIPETDLSEIKLLIHFYNNKNLAVLFDGFDEICPDYANEVIQLLCTLKCSKIAHLWVTSRQYNVLDQLESALGIFSYSLSPLTEPEQVQLLGNIWSHNLDLDKTLINTSRHVEEMYITIINVLKDTEGTFLSIPLHLYMVANIYETFFIDKIKTPSNEVNTKKIEITSNLFVLYEKFTNTIFTAIRFGDKKHSVSFRDPDMRKMMKRERKLFVKDHTTAAAYLVFDRSILFCRCNVGYVHKFINSVKLGEEKTGIIESVIHDKPKFVHFTFAEYFAAEFILDKLSSAKFDSTIWKYFIENVLVDAYHGIRRFINSKLQFDETVAINIRCNEEHMKTVWDILLAQGCKPSTVFDTTVSENLDHITMFIVQCVKTYVTKENIHNFVEFISHPGNAAFIKGTEEVKVSFNKSLLEIITNMDRNLVRELFSYLFAKTRVISGEVAFNVLNSLINNSENIVDFLTRLQPWPFDIPIPFKASQTVAHFFGTDTSALSLCSDFLLKLSMEQRAKIFNAVDYEGKLPAHTAAEENNYEFFVAMNQLVGEAELKKMCTTVDIYGFTPICRFDYNNLDLHAFKTLLRKVYEEDIGVEDFVFNKLPKLYPKLLPDSFDGSEFSYAMEKEVDRKVFVGTVHCI